MELRERVLGETRRYSKVAHFLDDLNMHDDYSSN